MARLRFSKEFRARFSEKLMDLGNFVAVGLVIGQLVSGKEFSVEMMLIGIMGTIIFYIASFIISS